MALILTARRRATAADALPGDADWERRLTYMLRTRKTSQRAVAIEISLMGEKSDMFTMLDEITNNRRMLAP